MREDTPPNRRHPRHALTAVAVQKAKPNGRVHRLADGGGLYLVVSPNGSKSWVLRTVATVDGKHKRCDIGLGGAQVVTLAEAREEAHRLRKIARAGGNPLVERRRERRPVPAFRAAAEEMHASHGRAFKNAKHRKQWLASLGCVFDAFGEKRVDEVTTDDVLSALNPHWLVRPETSRRVLQRVRRVFNYCKARGFRSGDNPADGLTAVLPKQRRSGRHHAALPYQQTPAFIEALRTAPAAECVRLAFEFTILCAVRTAETLLATWNEIDLDAKTWTIPGARMKAGVEHRVPLSARCIEILESAKKLSTGGPYVFPGRSVKKPLSNMAFLMTLRRMKRQDITAHGFRSTFRDWAAESTNYPRAVCDMALAHKLKDKTEAAYFRSDLFNRRRALMDEWARFATTAPAPGNSGKEGND